MSFIQTNSIFFSLVEVIVSRCTTEQLMKMYNVSYFNNAHEFLVLLAQQRGKLKKVVFIYFLYIQIKHN